MTMKKHIKTILIQSADSSHAEKLTDLIYQLGYTLSISEMKRRVEVYSTQPFYQAWVALADRYVVGSIALCITDNFIQDERFATIISLVVDKVYRRQGIGGKLLRHAENYAKKQNCNHIELITHERRAVMGTHKFYYGLGYQSLNEEVKFMQKNIDRRK